jgi:hypothetical protein
MFESAAVDPIVGVLAELAGGGRALELGIGTGRIALPLARRGVPVHGIDMSRAGSTSRSGRSPSASREPASRCRPTVRHAGGIVTARRTAW